jgi:hypothetical protein
MQARSLSALALVVGLLAGPTAARAEWEVVATKQGVEVSQQAVEGRSLPMFRGIGEVDGSPDQVLAVLQDVDKHVEWMPDTAEARLVRESEEAVWMYRLTDAPWPVSDRDVVVKSHLEIVEPEVEIHTFFEAVEVPEVPERRGVVRMPHLVGHWKLRAIAPGRSRVEYQVDVDPGGRLPGWLAARTSRDNPVWTIVGLRKRLAEIQRENAKASSPE